MSNTLNFAELKELYNQDYKISLFIRHAEREEIDPRDPEMGMGALLTETGKEQGRKLGEKLSYFQDFSFTSSAVERCKQTCRAVAVGAGLGEDISIAESPLFGIPGVYISGIESQHEMERLGFMEFTEQYIKNGEAKGMRPVGEASEDLLAEILKVSTAKMNICASHDLFVGVLMSHLQLRTVTIENWISFLEAVAILQAPDKSVSYKIFNPLADL
ncbi:MAG: histidine phosphatase family protein [Fibrobacter sp.]|nr:histidine phosphatase family protein [Fibrobacter sp.]